MCMKIIFQFFTIILIMCVFQRSAGREDQASRGKPPCTTTSTTGTPQVPTSTGTIGMNPL